MGAGDEVQIGKFRIWFTTPARRVADGIFMSLASTAEATKVGAVAKRHVPVGVVPAYLPIWLNAGLYEVDQAPVLKIGQVVDELEAEFPALTVSKVRLFRGCPAYFALP